ncbi:MAG: hypothetical protein IMW84_08840 [Thermoanaerobacter sp.]|nr:hypothetical protein [Thermoanaerobacter sp.]
MTTIYFIRHAESNYTEHNDELRPLVELHGGTIKAYNSEKGGACISFNITNYFKE